MGRPKPLLPVGGRSFLEACLSVLRQGGCGVVVVVLPGEGDGVTEADARARAAGAIVVRNETERSEQVDSLRLGLDALEGERVRSEPLVEGALVLPVDHPLVNADTVRAVMAQRTTRPEAIVRPVHDGRPGHPTLFPRSLWPALRDPDLPRGARSLVESPGTRTVDVEVDDPGVVADIDTPEAYRRYVGGAP